jgi:hypothetical protein
MRTITSPAKLILGGALMAAIWLPGEASAYEGPWCLRASVGRGTVAEICHFATFEACARERFHYGSTSFCGQNPRYLPYWQGRGFGAETAPPPRRYKKKHRHS